jgi:hypothetical protein
MRRLGVLGELVRLIIGHGLPRYRSAVPPY